MERMVKTMTNFTFLKACLNVATRQLEFIHIACIKFPLNSADLKSVPRVELKPHLNKPEKLHCISSHF